MSEKYRLLTEEDDEVDSQSLVNGQPSWYTHTIHLKRSFVAICVVALCLSLAANLVAIVHYARTQSISAGGDTSLYGTQRRLYKVVEVNNYPSWTRTRRSKSYLFSLPLQ